MKKASNVLRWTSVGLGLTFLSLCAVAQADEKLLRERDSGQRPTLLVVGVAHFDNPGRDVVNPIVDDVLSVTRQAQIERVVEQLAFFRPTYIAVEWPKSEQVGLDARYQDYREGRYQLTRSETDQFGLRLAAKLGLPRVHAVDWNGLPPGDEKHFDWFEYGKSHGQGAAIAAIIDPKRMRGVVPQGNQSIGAWIGKLNDSEVLAEAQRSYFDIALIGDPDDQPGANWVGYWYSRNLRIFGNLVRLTEKPEDRILVIYGQGHAYLLRQFARESGAFRLVDVGAVLKN
jgi:hypothetical protein